MNRERHFPESFTQTTLKQDSSIARPKEFSRLSSLEETLKRKYEDLINMLPPEPHPDAFTRIGTPESRTRDQHHQDAQTVRFGLEKKETPELAFGDLLEAFMQVELSRQNWFGARFVRVSKFDDYDNGIDGVLEWSGDHPETSFRLALDFTVAANDDVLKKKLGKLQRGNRVRYFQSSVKDARGRTYETSLSNLPMVILGVDRATLRKILEETNTDREKLAEHPIRALLVEQAAIQTGLQVRELCARLVGNTIGRDEKISERIRTAVQMYREGIKSDREFTKKIDVVADLFSGIPKEELTQAFQDKDQADRLFQILHVYKKIEEARTQIKDELTSATQWVGDSRTHRRLAAGSPALSFSSSLFIRQFFCFFFSQNSLQSFLFRNSCRLFKGFYRCLNFC